MSLWKFLLTANACALITVAVGCASSAVDPAFATPIKNNFVYSHQSKSSESDAAVTIVRDSGFVGGGCRLGFYIGGELAADFETKETATFYLKPDEYRLGVGSPKSRKGLCFVGAPQLRERETTLKAGQAKRFRIFVDSNGTFDILPY